MLKPSYPQVVKLLERFVKLEGIKPGLERISALLKLLGNPEQHIPVIHIAGTNGKGSVSMLCTSALLECNYKVGTYLSPHLLKYNERFLYQGKEISNSEFVSYFQKVWLMSKKVPGLTEFEILTAMAFLYFKAKNVDVAILETGLGGRFDATNVSRSILTILTPIALDHEKILGHTLAKIAWEKVGIVKPKVPIVAADQKPEAMQVIMQRAEELESDLLVVCHPLKFKLENLFGEYQRYNAALVVEGLRALRHYQIYIPRRLMLNGIAKTKIPGRTEVFSEKPTTILDVAHNPQAFENLTQVVDEKFPFKQKIYILGLLKRKNLAGVLKVLRSKAGLIIAVNLAAESAYTAADILKAAKALNIKNVLAKPRLSQAYTYAKKLAAAEQQVIVIAGSFYLIGEFYRKYKANKKK